MSTQVLLVDSFFDGQRLHAAGPYAIEIVDDTLRRIEAAPRNGFAVPATSLLEAPFAMPGLVEAHCHLFLDGAELDVQVRKDYLKAPLEQMLQTGRRSLAENLSAGITLIRDAGDLHGINHQLKNELAAQPGPKPELRSPGQAIRKAGRYGSFMALEVSDRPSLVEAVSQITARADDLKILLTGIIDFEKGEVKGGPQFELAEVKLMVELAHERGVRTYAHCSGTEGLQLALDAGVDSIEHGFFMTRELLWQMADQGTAWVPTFSPVYFQYARPDLAGWKPETVEKLRRICDNHFQRVAEAVELGVPVLPGSDAGSYGVPHGNGLIDELFFLRRAGISVDKILAAATSLPRRLWHCEPADLQPGRRVNLVLLEGSPFEDLQNLRRVSAVLRNGATTAACPVAVSG